MDPKSFLSKTARAFSLDIDNTHVSDAYVRIGVHAEGISVLEEVIGEGETL
jgi:hypothetical protein